MKRVLGFFSSILLLWGCSGGASMGVEVGELLYETRYAERFELYAGNSEGEFVLRVKNPWQGADSVVKDYRLVADTTQLPGTGAVRWPIRRAVCMSSSHVAFLTATGMTEVVKGVSGLGFISDPEINYEGTSVRDVGYESNLNYETIVLLRPDVVFIYGVTADDASMVTKLEQLGIPVVYIADYLEQTPLGRAEWVVPFGLLAGKMDKAVELFMHVEQEYKLFGEMVAAKVMMSEQERPAVMLNAPYKDVWYMPGDRSYMVRLIGDAGGDYLGKGEDTDASRPVSMERALMLMTRADYWLNPGMAQTMREVKQDNRMFMDMPLMREGRVYNNNARSTSQGGSDFWESGVVRPDVVLQDMVRILHPELVPEHELYYFHQLK